MRELLISLVISFTISSIFTPLVRDFFIYRGWVEDPQKKHKLSGNATALTRVPRGGGLPVYLSIILLLVFFVPGHTGQRLAIGAALSLTLIIGLWDDLKDISPKLRLVTNLLAAIIVVSAGINIGYISSPFGGVIDFSQYQYSVSVAGISFSLSLSALLAIFWIVACMNVVGWSAGVEGQLPGFVSITAFFIGLVGLRFSQDSNQQIVILLSGALAGAYLGFLPFNFFPQQIMPGYSGKSLAGFMIAVISILSGAKLATVILLLGIPIIDAMFVIVRRLLSGRSPLVGGPDHFHHFLLKLGWSRQGIAILYMIFSLFLGTLSLFLDSSQKLYVFIGLFIIFLGITTRLFQRT